MKKLLHAIKTLARRRSVKILPLCLLVLLVPHTAHADAGTGFVLIIYVQYCLVAAISFLVWLMTHLYKVKFGKGWLVVAIVLGLVQVFASLIVVLNFDRMWNFEYVWSEGYQVVVHALFLLVTMWLVYRVLV